MEKLASSVSPERTAKVGGELPALTGLRFFAAFYVVFYHFVAPNLRGAPSAVTNVFSVGYTAVGFFFLLSGFVLSYSYLRDSGTLSTERRSFWIARFARIYPAYLFSFLLAAPLQILGSIHVNGLHLGLKKLIVGGGLFLTLVQAWTPWTAWYWNSPAWSLSVEVFFYFCFPFAAIALGRLRPARCLPVALGLWFLALLPPVAYSMLRHAVPQPPLPSLQLALETNPIMRLPEFLIGILIGRLYVSGYRLKPRSASVLAFVALAGLVVTVSFSALIPRPVLANGFLVPFSGLLIFALAQQQGVLAKVLSHPILKLLGEASYAIYILQIPVAQLMGFRPETFSVTRFGLYAGLLIATSVFTLFFIEQPLRRRIKVWLRGSSRPKAVQQHSVIALEESPAATGQLSL